MLAAQSSSESRKRDTTAPRFNPITSWDEDSAHHFGGGDVPPFCKMQSLCSVNGVRSDDSVRVRLSISNPARLFHSIHSHQQHDQQHRLILSSHHHRSSASPSWPSTLGTRTKQRQCCSFGWRCSRRFITTGTNPLPVVFGQLHDCSRHPASSYLGDIQLYKLH